MEGDGDIMNNIYINLKELYRYTLKDIFENQDLVSIEELIDKLEEYLDTIKEQEEIIGELKEYRKQYCELYDQYCR